MAVWFLEPGLAASQDGDCALWHVQTAEAAAEPDAPPAVHGWCAQTLKMPVSDPAEFLAFQVPLMTP